MYSIQHSVCLQFCIQQYSMILMAIKYYFSIANVLICPSDEPQLRFATGRPAPSQTGARLTGCSIQNSLFIPYFDQSDKKANYTKSPKKRHLS